MCHKDDWDIRTANHERRQAERRILTGTFDPETLDDGLLCCYGFYCSPDSVARIFVYLTHHAHQETRADPFGNNFLLPRLWTGRKLVTVANTCSALALAVLLLLQQ